MSYADPPRNEDTLADEEAQSSIEGQAETANAVDRAKPVIGACRSRRGAAIVTHSTSD